MCVCVFIGGGGEGDGEGDHANMQSEHNLLSILTKHIVMFHYCGMMDLTFTETCGPLDCLSGSLTQINLHQIMGISKPRSTP